MSGETVLIVEDRRENIVHLANNVLKPGGYEIITAMDGQKGLKRVLADRPDLVILDMNMPRMDGLEVLAALRERNVDIPVILTTFYGSEQVAEQAMRLGAVAYMVKPYDTVEMLGAIRKALSQRSAPPSPPPAAEPVAEIMPLTRQVERWMRDMNILTRVGKSLVALQDLHQVCTRAVEAAIYVTRSDYGFLFLDGYESEGGLYLCSLRGPRDQRARLVGHPVDEGLAFEVFHSGQAVLRTASDGETALGEIAGGPLGPLAAVPLRWEQETCGVLAVVREPGERPFDDSDVEWLSGLSDYAAIAIRNTRAFQQAGLPQDQAEAKEEKLADLGQEVRRLISVLEAANLAAERLDVLLSLAGIDSPTNAAQSALRRSSGNAPGC